MGKSMSKMVSTIRSQLSAHMVTDDTRLEGELVEDMLLDVRSILIKEFYISKHYLDDNFFQINDGIKVENRHATSKDGVSEQNPELYSIIPVIQSEVGYSNIKYLGTFDNRNGFTRLSISGFNATEGKLFTRNDPYYTALSSTLLLKNLPNLGMKYLRMIAVSYDPRKVFGYVADQDFPLPDSMIHKAELLTIKQLMSTLGISPDIVNDAQDVVIKAEK